MRHVTIVTLCLLALAAGCATTFRRDADVEMLGSTTAVIDGKTVAIDDAPARLKAVGAGRETSVRIIIPRGVSQEGFKRIAKILASAGYTKIFFATVRHADAEVKK